MKKILILGASGFVGKAISDALKTSSEVYGSYFEHKDQMADIMKIKLDISKDEQILNVLETIEPDIVISSLRGDFVYQLRAHEHIAKYLVEHGSRLIYLSSANVFDAVTDQSHVESDTTSSNSDYGQFKIHCEEMLHKLMGPLVTTIRLPMIFGKNSKRIDDTRNCLSHGQPLLIYRDFFLSMHSDILLAKQIAYIVENHIEGILHLGSHDVITHVEAMSLLAKQLGYEKAELRYERIQDQPYYLALATERNALPIDLLYSCQQVINSIK